MPASTTFIRFLNVPLELQLLVAEQTSLSQHFYFAHPQLSIPSLRTLHFFPARQRKTHSFHQAPSTDAVVPHPIRRRDNTTSDCSPKYLVSCTRGKISQDHCRCSPLRSVSAVRRYPVSLQQHLQALMLTEPAGGNREGWRRPRVNLVRSFAPLPIYLRRADGKPWDTEGATWSEDTCEHP